MNTTTPDLKPCPFCGGEANAAPHGVVICSLCGSKGGLWKTVPEAITAWNRRAPSELERELEAEIADLKRQVQGHSFRKGERS